MIAAIGNHLWQSTLFACAVAVLVLLLRGNRAAVRHGLWLGASAKFLLPFSLLIAAGSHVEWRKAPAIAKSQSAVVEQIGEPFAAPLSARAPASVPAAPSRLPAVWFSLWLCGFLASLLAWGWRWRRVRAAVRSASPLDLKLPIRTISSPSRLEPGIFGVWRPVLLLPEGIAERLTPAQFQAILAHEMCHVRRRDNLTASIHMLVEALFWFHPLVWWIGRRLVEERERACDEEVLRMGGDPQDYAEGIVNVCKFYLESPLVCVSGVTGANLKRRVEAIMLNRAASNLGFMKKLALAVAGGLAVAAPLMVGILSIPSVRAQPQAPAAALPRSTSVSIKTIGPDAPVGPAGPRMIDPQHFEAASTVHEMIQWAYGLARDFQVSGGPAWLGVPYFDSSGVRVWPAGESFEIEAMADRPTSEAEMKRMVQALLADRFKLKAHIEMRQIPVYAIVIGPDGPRLPPETEPACGVPANPDSVCGFPAVNAAVDHGFGVQPGVREIIARGGTMTAFAALLTNNVDRPVVDKTGLTAGYNFYLPYEHSGPGWQTGRAIFPAIQTLGLRLEPLTQSFETVVIDSAERPATD